DWSSDVCSSDLPALWADPRIDLRPLPHPRIGVCWRGSGTGARGFLPGGADARDVPATALRALLELPRLTWVGLQLADHARELPIPALDTFGVTDFADTAGVIAQLDLVIASDTAVAHLAASLGAPTWVLVPA